MGARPMDPVITRKRRPAGHAWSRRTTPDEPAAVAHRPEPSDARDGPTRRAPIVGALVEACHHPIRWPSEGSGWGTSRTTGTVIRFGGCLRHARYGAMGRIEPGRGQARPRTNRHADREAVMGFDQQDRHFAPRRTAQTGLTR